MLRSFLLISVRKMGSKGGIALLNIICLALGIASCLFIANFLHYEFSFDRFHEKSDRIFRLETDSYYVKEITSKDAFTTFETAPQLKSKFSEVESFFRLIPFTENYSEFLISQDEDHKKTNFVETAYYADNTIFNLFDLDFRESQAGILSRPNTIAISYKLAKKMFPKKIEKGQSVLGQRIQTRSSDLNNIEYEITGVFNDIPENSHLKFDALFSLVGEEYVLNLPNYENSFSYLLLSQNANWRQINDQLIDETKNSSINYYKSISLYPLEEIHLGHQVSNQPSPPTNPMFLIFLGAIGLIVLLLSTTNYINNSIITALDRAKEVGLRKLLGVSPNQLSGSIYLECLLTNAFSGLLAIVIFIVGQKSVRVFMDIGYPETLELERVIILVITFIGLITLCTFFTAFYPSRLLNSLKLTEALKGKSVIFQSKQSSKGARAMKTLLVFQLTVSMIFISAAYVVYKQLKHIKQNDNRAYELEVQGKFPGFAGANEFYTDYSNNFISKAIDNGAIKSVGLSNMHKGQVRMKQYIRPLTQIEKTDSDNYDGQFLLSLVDYNYWKNDSMAFISGKNFNSIFGYDYNGVIINEAALFAMQFNNPEEAIGETVGKYNGPLEVKGVIRNDSINDIPKVFVTGFRFPSYFNITLEAQGNSSEKINATLESLRKSWNPKFNNFYIITRNFETQSLLEQSLLKLFIFFTGIAVFVACTGVYSLSAFTAQKRTKEMGLRKILGADVSQILFVLIYDFMRLIFICSLISIPLIIYGIKSWLSNYTYRIDLQPSLLIIPILIMTIIAISIIVKQSWRTAVISPLSAINR